MRYYVRFAIILPIAIMAICGAIQYLIPGCTIDEGAGASTACGVVGPLLSNGLFGGFLWLIFGIFGMLPAAVISAFFVKKDVTSSSTRSLLQVLKEDEARKEQEKDRSKNEHNGEN